MKFYKLFIVLGIICLFLLLSCMYVRTVKEDEENNPNDEENPNKEIEFWYNFPMINTYQRIIESELDDTNVKIHYIPQSFKKYFVSKVFFNIFVENPPKYAKPILDSRSNW